MALPGGEKGQWTQTMRPFYPVSGARSESLMFLFTDGCELSYGSMARSRPKTHHEHLNQRTDEQLF